jgi:hypothetical protein
LPPATKVRSFAVRPTVLQGAELRRQADRAEEHQQQGVADLHIEGDLEIGHAVENRDDYAAEQPAGDRRRYVELAQNADYSVEIKAEIENEDAKH